MKSTPTAMRPIVDVAETLQIPPEDLVVFGEHMAKLRLRAMPDRDVAPDGRLILVSAINPTRSGEGKTTVSIGLAQGLQRAGQRVALALREPSLGPIFGIKGGGTGGGRCQIEPSTRINMHFTGDLHAVGAAHNLLAALVDDAIHFRSDLDLAGPGPRSAGFAGDPRRWGGRPCGPGSPKGFGVYRGRAGRCTRRPGLVTVRGESCGSTRPC